MFLEQKRKEQGNLNKVLYLVKKRVPELKCILSGARMSEFLEFRTLIAKFFGLIAALGGGKQNFIFYIKKTD